MLKGISPILSPELLRIIAEMGHGDELVLADGNFPGTSIGRRCVRCDGHGCAEVMRAVVQLFPLDDFVDKPLAVMEVPKGMFPGDQAPIWEAFRAAAALDTLRARFGGDPFTLAQARDALGISRTYALLFLEYWDKLGITRKTGDWRVFR